MGTETGRRDFWQAHIEAWWESGLTQRAYCQEHRLAEAQFSHWKPRLRKTGQRQHPKAQLVPVKVTEEAEAVPQRDRGDVHGPTSSGGDLALVFGDGLRLEIGGGFDAATLQRVLEVLGHVG